MKQFVLAATAALLLVGQAQARTVPAAAMAAVCSQSEDECRGYVQGVIDSFEARGDAAYCLPKGYTVDNVALAFRNNIPQADPAEPAVQYLRDMLGRLYPC